MLTARYYACTIRHRTTVSVIKNKMLKRYLHLTFAVLNTQTKLGVCIMHGGGGVHVLWHVRAEDHGRQPLPSASLEATSLVFFLMWIPAKLPPNFSLEE